MPIPKNPVPTDAETPEPSAEKAKTESPPANEVVNNVEPHRSENSDSSSRSNLEAHYSPAFELLRARPPDPLAQDIVEAVLRTLFEGGVLPPSLVLDQTERKRTGNRLFETTGKLSGEEFWRPIVASLDSATERFPAEEVKERLRRKSRHFVWTPSSIQAAIDALAEPDPPRTLWQKLGKTTGSQIALQISSRLREWFPQQWPRIVDRVRSIDDVLRWKAEGRELVANLIAVAVDMTLASFEGVWGALAKKTAEVSLIETYEQRAREARERAGERVRKLQPTPPPRPDPVLESLQQRLRARTPKPQRGLWNKLKHAAKKGKLRFR